MDLNKPCFSIHLGCESAKNDAFGDTALRLECLGHTHTAAGKTSRSGNSRSAAAAAAAAATGAYVPDDGCRLVLGLGPTPTPNLFYNYDHGCCAIGGNRSQESLTSQGLTCESESSAILKLGLPERGEQGNLVSFQTQITSDHRIFYQSEMPAQDDDCTTIIPVVDEGSTSAKKSGGYMPSLLLAPRQDGSTSKSLMQSGEVQDGRDHYSCLSSEQSDTLTFSAGTFSEQRGHHPKKCKFDGCVKGARGASGLCIAHGGGQRCVKPGCNKGAESRTAYCKSHGGGRRCQCLGCTKSAEGKTDYCIAHGGGRRCGHSGCTKAARGKSGLCIRHGGGKRCTVEGCMRSAEGQAGLCISHGGGRRCQYSACNKGAQGSTIFCKAHGGGKRCVFAGCNKGAEGSTPLCKGHGGGKRCLFDGGGICPKSVHGGTDYCVAHGGGKRCAVSGCTKSARGRTDCCVRHGGGKRCKVENCGKSAQGSTDFCKAHGGGKRCTWGEGKCEKFARGRSGLCAAHGSMVQVKMADKSGMIGPGLFSGLVPISTLDSGRSSSGGVSTVSDCTDSADKPRKTQLIPPQVLVPLSMKSSSSSGRLLADRDEEGGSRGKRSFNFGIPEGRVHGGGLMSLLGGSLRNAIDHGL
ncbi:hypothetical protein Scep_000891 [Stephania cephalantha]|uniref:WRKY19-like zinc finger domain-containing protein n=1 Tax=Stephania cephalantha TaxID=152367 RepID=A0AAP0Q3B2_9MAGN